jgi:hypothetical protein
VEVRALGHVAQEGIEAGLAEAACDPKGAFGASFAGGAREGVVRAGVEVRQDQRDCAEQDDEDERGQELYRLAAFDRWKRHGSGPSACMGDAWNSGCSSILRIAAMPNGPTGASWRMARSCYTKRDVLEDQAR